MSFVLEDKYIGRHLPSNRVNDDPLPAIPLAPITVSDGPPPETGAPRPPPRSEEIEVDLEDLEIGSSSRPPPRSEEIDEIDDPDRIEQE
jgi:hypothetical protein